jgi:hypothetical protein
MIEVIPYDPMLTKITRNVSATLLLCRLEMLFARTAGASFVKFLEPAPGHPDDRPGESFAEELALSAEAFRTAFKKIGVRHRSRRAFEAAAAAGSGFVATMDANAFSQTVGAAASISRPNCGTRRRSTARCGACGSWR